MSKWNPEIAPHSYEGSVADASRRLPIALASAGCGTMLALQRVWFAHLVSAALGVAGTAFEISSFLPALLAVAVLGFAAAWLAQDVNTLVSNAMQASTLSFQSCSSSLYHI